MLSKKSKVAMVFISLLMVFVVSNSAFASSYLNDNNISLAENKAAILKSIHTQLVKQGKEDQYKYFKEMIDNDFFEMSNKDAGYYHYNGGATHYEVDFGTNVTYNRIFIPHWKGKQFLQDVNESQAYGEGVGYLIDVLTPQFMPLWTFMNWASSEQISRLEKIFDSGVGAQIMSTMDGEGDGATVVFEWTNNYLMYHSNAKNLKIVKW